MTKPGSWKFDDTVAKRFDTEAHTHIPHYEEIIQKCLMVADAAFANKKNVRILDVGSATGYTLKRFRDAGYTNIYGVDSSAAMLAQSCVQENLICSDTFPRENGPFDLVLANWTLHFVKEREAYIREIRETLRRGGFFILSDKMDSSPFVHERYYDFKRSQGVTDEAIREKEISIRGTLVTKPLEWYMETLKKVGFTEIDIIDASWCFKTLLCR